MISSLEQTVLRVQELWIYPVKSCRGIRVQKLSVDEFGPLYDREWVVVDENHKFITQREKNILAQVATELTQTELILRHGGEQVSCSLDVSSSDPIPHREKQQVTVWAHQLSAWDEGDVPADFFSTILQQKVRLMRFERKAQRSVGSSGAVQTRFADQFPFHVVHQALIDELQTRFPDQKIEVQSFRPNIILNGPLAKEEDLLGLNFDDFQLLEGKPTSRCVITTLDPVTGKKRGPEPLKTLAQTRRVGNKVYFGMHYIHSGPGVLIEGQHCKPIAL